VRGGDGGGALRVPELIQRPLQILRRIQVVLEQELHRVFARFSTFAHKSTQSCRRTGWWETKNCVAGARTACPRVFEKESGTRG